mmetsp:Transcript_20043/g.48144  ORF Transcript_20043/g.48144 Transcript_20043/m.48144 type:complete len:283 (-) Transcript_20043:1709-2557(-)
MMPRGGTGGRTRLEDRSLILARRAHEGVGGVRVPGVAYHEPRARVRAVVVELLDVHLHRDGPVRDLVVVEGEGIGGAPDPRPGSLDVFLAVVARDLGRRPYHLIVVTAPGPPGTVSKHLFLRAEPRVQCRARIRGLLPGRILEACAIRIHLGLAKYRPAVDRAGYPFPPGVRVCTASDVVGRCNGFRRLLSLAAPRGRTARCPVVTDGVVDRAVRSRALGLADIDERLPGSGSRGKGRGARGEHVLLDGVILERRLGQVVRPVRRDGEPDAVGVVGEEEVFR